MESQVYNALEVLRGAAGGHATDLQEIADLVANICECELSAISLLDDDTYYLTITHGMAPLQCHSSESLCQFTMAQEGPVVLTHLEDHADFADSPYVDGTKMSLRFYASAPIYAPDGEMIGRLSVFDTRQRELNALQLRALNVLAAGVTDVLRLQLATVLPYGSSEMALMAEQEIARIAAEISHDMRAPLATILGNLEMLLEEADASGADSSVKAMLGRTERAGQRLMAMVEQLLAFHRAGTNEVWESVDLNKLMRQLLFDLEEELQRVEAVVEVESLPVVTGNGYQLGTVLLNLITNAIKFAKPGVPLRLHIGSEDTGSKRRVRVSDNGVGVPLAAQDRVFRMFGRANGRIEGHGIGLATASRIVRAHGGDMGLVSDGNSGTEVWFDLNSIPVVPTQRS